MGGAYFYLDSLIKSGIEVAGSSALGAAVTVDSVSISPLSGAGTIRGLRIANVEGYSREHALRLGEVSVQLDAASLFSDVVEVDSVNIIAPVISYETKIRTDNIRELLNNLPQGDGSSAPATTSEAGVLLIVREINMLGAQANLVAMTMEAPVSLPDIQLRNIGTSDDAATVPELARTVLGALSRALLNADLPTFDMLREGVEDRVREGVEELGNRLRGILNQQN